MLIYSILSLVIFRMSLLLVANSTVLAKDYELILHFEAKILSGLKHQMLIFVKIMQCNLV